MDREKIIIRNTAQQYSVVTPDVDHAVLIAIEQDQPNNTPPPPTLYIRSPGIYSLMQVCNSHSTLWTYIYLYDSVCYTIAILQNRIR